VEQNTDESVRRVRRGCLGGAAVMLALGLLLVTQTGNLFWSVLGVVAIALFIFSRLIK
jgi:hypothetical protein